MAAVRSLRRKVLIWPPRTNVGSRAARSGVRKTRAIPSESSSAHSCRVLVVEVGGDERTVDLLLANQEGCAGDTDDMHGRARFNQARAQVSDIWRFADNQDCGAWEI